MPAADAPRSRLHPWHGVAPGPNPPGLVTAYIEITPRDVVKYELDKHTGLLQVDRVQLTSSSPPTLYGLIPRTYCGHRVAALSPGASRADGDPLDICVYSERPIDKADILLTARVVGGLRMIDGGEADDKIVAVLSGDPVWDDAEDLADIPANLIRRLSHYFLTYKMVGDIAPDVRIEEQYGRDTAFAVVEAAIADYREAFGGD